MASKKKTVTKEESIQLDSSGVTQSVNKVIFIASKDVNGLEKGKEYQVSENVAALLELKSLGNKKK
jgi:hypothetical protein